MLDIRRRPEPQLIQISFLKIPEDVVGEPIDQPQELLHLLILTPLVLVVDPVLRNRHQILHPLVDGEQLLVGGDLFLRDDDGLGEEAHQLQLGQVELTHHLEDYAEDGEGVVVPREEHLQHAFPQLLTSVEQVQHVGQAVVALCQLFLELCLG